MFFEISGVYWKSSDQLDPGICASDETHKSKSKQAASTWKNLQLSQTRSTMISLFTIASVPIFSFLTWNIIHQQKPTLHRSPLRSYKRDVIVGDPERTSFWKEPPGGDEMVGSMDQLGGFFDDFFFTSERNRRTWIKFLHWEVQL